MKHISITLGLFGCLASAACASAPRAPLQASEHASVRPAVAPFAQERTCGAPVTIARQSDVRSVGAFCTLIDGDLRIVGTDIRNLDGLEGVRSVRDLVVEHNPKLASVEGLRGLHAARGVIFADNPSLKSLEGLESLTHVDGAVLRSNGLTTLRGLEGLHSASDLVIVGNPDLMTLDAIQHLGAVSHLEISDNGWLAPERHSSGADRAEVAPTTMVVPSPIRNRSEGSFNADRRLTARRFPAGWASSVSWGVLGT